MDGLLSELARRFDAGKPLGYLNFATGAADARFRKFLADVFEFLADHPEPWEVVGRWLRKTVEELHAGGSAAFSDVTQVNVVLAAVFDHLPRLYRKHHADLLAHAADRDLFNAFFIARGCEAVLKERAAKPNAEPEKLASKAVKALNDYVGYRPIAVLETRPQTDYYPHEKVCPVPVYFPGAGVAPGKYADLIRPALELIGQTDPQLREDACYNPDKLDELSVDPRAADHFHPVNKRPNMLFGEWDPHRIDNTGYFRRFILRQPTLDALLSWVDGGRSGEPSERRFEAAAVLAGTILMGAGVSGSGPTHYDSTVTLAGLVQKIARYRDDFYKKLLAALPGRHGERLRDEAAKLKQPFAGVRQYLNAAIASERALHLQERRLALLYAVLGYPSAARERAALIPAPSVRFGCEIRLRQTAAEFAAQTGDVTTAARLLTEAEDLLRRGIDCGAIIDPWNVLGYQGLFPIFPGRDDTVRDPRSEELVRTAGRQFEVYAHAVAAAGSSADDKAREGLHDSMRSFANWWDKFATSTVSDLPSVVGSDRADAAGHVANALALWQKHSGSEVGFWRQHRDGFRTPAAFAQVIEALTTRGEYKAALALLVTWLGESDDGSGFVETGVPLSDAGASFLRSAQRWLSAVLADETVEEKSVLVGRFFELLESNAGDRWHVPEFGRRGPVPTEAGDDDEEDDPYSSAYEGVTFRDSADDGQEGALADDGPPPPNVGEFPLDGDADRYEDRLTFLAAIASLWRQAARPDLWPAASAVVLGDWEKTARTNLQRLRELINDLHELAVPEPSAGLDGVMEFDRRRVTKGRLLDLAVSTAVDTTAAIRAMAAVRSRSAELAASKGERSAEPAWEAVAVRLERAIAQSDPEAARKFLNKLVPAFKSEPLLVHPPADGGPPGAALRAQIALDLIESLLARLPRLGLLRETYQLTRLARAMERNDPPDGKRVSSFDQLFRTAVVGVVEALVDAATEWPEDGPDAKLAPALRLVAESFHSLWVDHSQTLRLSALEAVTADADWAELTDFVRTYGHDLFTVRFLTLSNVRGILTQGAAAWLDRQADEDSRPTTEPATKLAEAWADGTADKPSVARHLEIVLQALIEHYDEYRDYNTTTTQSDYGENLYILLDFLRLKVAYDRFAWRLRPLTLAHDVLCRRQHDALAADWRAFIGAKTKSTADDLLGKLTAREAEHGMRVRTVRDRLEERFVHPLTVDQAAARIAPAAAAAKEAWQAGQADDSNPEFEKLKAAIRPLAESPTGVGLDIPGWLRRLEDEVRKTMGGGDPDDRLAEPSRPVPRLDFGELRKQLAEWDKPLAE